MNGVLEKKRFEKMPSECFECNPDQLYDKLET